MPSGVIDLGGGHCHRKYWFWCHLALPGEDIDLSGNIGGLSLGQCQGLLL